MNDLLRIKQNVAKMVNMNAPEQDIDDYIVAEGVTVEDIRKVPLTVGSVLGKIPVKEYQEGRRNWLGNITERPEAATRAAMLKNQWLVPTGPFAGLLALSGIGGKEAQQAAIEASVNPGKVPMFQDIALEKYYDKEKPSGLRTAGGFGVSALGLGGDILASPFSALMALAGKTPIGGGRTAGAALMQTKPMQAVSRVANAPIEKAVNVNKFNKAVNTSISKAIRPSVAGKQTSGQVRGYYNKAQQAVQTIYENKNNLQFLDEAGQPVSKLPESLAEFSSAIEQTKNVLWSKIDSLAQQTGKAGLRVSADSIIKELKTISNNRVLQKLHPDIVQYADDQAKAFWNLRSLSPQEAQTEIKTLNESLKAFYKNPTFETARKAQVDALIANNLRKSLDDTVTKATEEGYQGLRNQYGALKAIEQDVNRRAIVDARKNIKGLIDFSDIFSGSDMIQGLLRMNPQMFASGIAKKGIATFIKMRNDPNRIIKRMFQVIEKVNRRGVIEVK